MRSLVRFSLLAILITACLASNQKPFDQMTAAEHLQAAAQEHRLADDNFARVSGENITPPETIPNDDLWGWGYAEWGNGPVSGSVYAYDWGASEIDDPEHYVAWPRVGDPSEKYSDAASKHRENALRHERAAAALEGRPSEQPLPPPSEPLIPPDRG